MVLCPKYEDHFQFDAVFFSLNKTSLLVTLKFDCMQGSRGDCKQLQRSFAKIICKDRRRPIVSNGISFRFFALDKWKRNNYKHSLSQSQCATFDNINCHKRERQYSAFFQSNLRSKRKQNSMHGSMTYSSFSNGEPSIF